MLFSILVLYTSTLTLAYTIQSLMVRTPDHVDQVELLRKHHKIPCAEPIRDMHVWSFGSNEILGVARLMVNSGENLTAVLKGAINVAKQAGIGHSTPRLGSLASSAPPLRRVFTEPGPASPTLRTWATATATATTGTTPGTATAARRARGWMREQSTR